MRAFLFIFYYVYVCRCVGRHICKGQRTTLWRCGGGSLFTTLHESHRLNLVHQACVPSTLVCGTISPAPDLVSVGRQNDLISSYWETGHEYRRECAGDRWQLTLGPGEGPWKEVRLHVTKDPYCKPPTLENITCVMCQKHRSLWLSYSCHVQRLSVRKQTKPKQKAKAKTQFVWFWEANFQAFAFVPHLYKSQCHLHHPSGSIRWGPACPGYSSCRGPLPRQRKPSPWDSSREGELGARQMLWKYLV